MALQEQMDAANSFYSQISRVVTLLTTTKVSRGVVLKYN